MSTPSSSPADRLAAARLAHWHQNAQPILTLNMLRDWLNASGLVLFAPRAHQLAAPAPSFVEAVLGEATAAPTLAQTEEPRSLLARLITDSGAVPLNLLGSAGGAGTEVPDFIVSPLAFPYIFTLRGDKNWKRAPEVNGANRVSPLALAAYNLLAERITMTASDLAAALGKEVTQAAVLRSLTDLWQHLRVFPVPQPNGAPALWELTATRFTKQIKTGANAGQPTALSALISLYLAQAMTATEEEIEAFLSPLAARSRIREVIHALLAARQLATIVIDGKTLLHVAGELPGVLAEAEPAAETVQLAEPVAEQEIVAQESDSDPRIKKFVPRPRKVGTGYVARPARPYSPENSGRERRPFNRAASRPGFDKPWEEERAARPAASRRPAAARDDEGRDRSVPRDNPRRPGFNREEKRPFGSKPRFDRERPGFRRDSEFGENRPPRRPYSKPGDFDRKREGSAGRSFDRGSSRPPRRDFGDSRPPRREFTPRSERENESRPPRREFGASTGGEKEFRRPRRDFGDSRPPRRDFGDNRKPEFSRNREDRPERREDRGPRSGPPFRKFDAPRRDRPERSFSGRSTSERPARPSSSERSDRPSRPARREDSGSFAPKKPYGKSSKPSGGYAKKSAGGSFAGKKPYGKSTEDKSGKPAGPFDKFKGNKKPFGKRPPARKFKRGDAAE